MADIQSKTTGLLIERDGITGSIQSKTTGLLIEYPGVEPLTQIKLHVKCKYDMEGLLRLHVKCKYDMGGILRFPIKVKYNLEGILRFPIRCKYNINNNVYLHVRSKYQILIGFKLHIRSKYHIVPAIAQWYDEDDSLLTRYVLPEVELGEVSSTIILHLWNLKGVTTGGLTMTNCRISGSLLGGLYAGGTDFQGQEIIDEQWMEAKSDGTSGGGGITDDAQGSFTPIGGDPSVGGNYLAIGNIPPNRARHIHIKLNAPIGAGTTFNAYPELLIQTDMV
jgi:hypothetical protein